MKANLRHRIWAVSILMLAGMSALVLGVGSRPRPQLARSSPSAAPVSQAPLAALPSPPLSFEENVGQTDPRVRFLSHGGGYAFYLTPGEAVLSLQRPAQESKHTMAAGGASPAGESAQATPPGPLTALRMKLVGANATPQVTGLDRLPGKSNYLIGRDRRKWHINVANYAKVKYASVYPGVDLVYYGNQGRVEYDFLVAPGADPNAIKIAFNGSSDGQALAPQVDGQGDLVFHAAGGDVRFHKPVVYQGAAEKHLVAGRYTVQGSEIGFALEGYDASQPLVIDPVLSFSTYLGGSSKDYGNTVVADKTGNVYVTGSTRSVDFPTKNPIESFHGGTCGSFPCRDIFITKFNSTATALIFSTFIGGTGDESGVSMALDSLNNMFVTGFTTSTDFPVTPGAFQTVFGGGSNQGDAYALELNSAGTALVYATYIGGSGDEIAEGMVLDKTNNAYITGYTRSTNYPTTAGVIQSSCTTGLCGFVTKLNPTGTALVYSTIFGGTAIAEGFGIALDSAKNAYVAGVASGTGFPTTPGVLQPNCPPSPCGSADEGFVLKLNTTATKLLFSTYLDGTLDSFTDGIALDKTGNIYVAGGTDSTDFPTTAGAAQTVFGGSTPSCRFTPASFLCGDAFVSKLNKTATALVYSTYIGGSLDESAQGLGLDAGGNVYAQGVTTSTNFPTVNATQSAYGGNQDVFVTKVNVAGSAFAYSTYYGGSGQDNLGTNVFVDSSGSAYTTGGTISTDLPTTAGAFQTQCGTDGTCNGGLLDAFVMKIADKPVLKVSITGQSLSGGVLSVTYSVKDTGMGPAMAVTVTKVIFKTLKGTGTVTYNSPTLPVVIGSISQAGSASVTLNYNVPGTVTKFSATETLTLKDDGGAVLTPAVATQTIVP